MKHRSLFFLSACAAAGFLFAGARAGSAQVTPAAGYTPPDDKPSVKVGGVVFADYTYQDNPKVTDSGGNSVHQNSFNVGRAYINVTGNISHLVSFRITPDITRESGTGSSLNGSYTFRLKYAYGQLNLDDWATKGSWMRLGLQQTPFIDYHEGVYRYRFQGPIFVDREGFLTSSDLALSGHYAFPENYGDVHVGVYNGEGYTKPEANDQKAFQVRATVRPAPMVPVLKGLRLTGFYDADHYVQSAKKQRFVGNLMFEHPYVNVGFDYLDARDQTSVTKPEVHATGWSGWITPRTPFGLEALIRYDELKPNKDTINLKKKRLIAGVSYWLPPIRGVVAAFLLDYENVKYDNFLPAKPEEKRYALHALFNF